jgi:prepilin-type N-terminal cleavage/methylation domain-containing protein
VIVPAFTHDIIRLGKRLAVRLAGERGFTLIEMLIAAIIMLVGIVATIGAFGSSKHTTLVAQRSEVAIHQAQRELERMRALKYDAIGLNTTSAPAHASDPADPNYRVQAGGVLRIKPGPPALDEELVLLGTEPGGKVDPGPESYTIGEGGGAVTGKIYRYVTWRDEKCPTGICDGTHNTKRLVVAITVDRGNIGPRNPIWVSTIVANPNESVTGEVAPPAPAPSTSAQNFYLYDQRCRSSESSNSYTAPTAGHSTQDTASAGAACELSDSSGRQPSLMGPATPMYDDPPLPPFKYSSDLSGDYPAGLAMIRSGSACPATSYPVNDQTGKWSMHAWATKKFSADFNLTGNAFVTLWTTSVGSLSGAGRICATLVDRLYSGTTNDVVLGSATYETAPWPTTKNEPGKSCGTSDFPCAAQRTFSFSVSGTKVRANGRLLLILTVLGSSDKDLVFLYDDPRYRSFVEVETNTPCDDSGTPCATS